MGDTRAFWDFATECKIVRRDKNKSNLDFSTLNQVINIKQKIRFQNAIVELRSSNGFRRKRTWIDLYRNLINFAIEFKVARRDKSKSNLDSGMLIQVINSQTSI